MQKYGYLTGQNADYIDELFERYLENPDSVDESWRYFFEGMELNSDGSFSQPPVGEPHAPSSPIEQNGKDPAAEAAVGTLISAYRSRGRLLANIDPLNPPPSSHPLMELEVFKLSPKDLERSFEAGALIGLGKAKLSAIVERLKRIYCSSIGVEFTHINDFEIRAWLQKKMEGSENEEKLDPDTCKFILRRLTESESFERFLHTRYVAQKRFSLEGGESLIPCLDRMIEVAANNGCEQVVMGMAHRGRLNVLHNIYGKKAEFIFTEFEQNYVDDESAGEGDVKYHMGFSADITTRSGKEVHLSLAHNPSHLEFVNPVIQGICRGKQRYLGDTDRSKVVPIAIHGDAAFAGQGVCYETLNLSEVSGYETGGTLHIVINNQIGFTTDPKDSRSTPYATDLAKMLQVPVFHVNGDDPEAIWWAARLATEFRLKFKKDVFIDLICYRKYGHNEGDEPSFTQPLLYKKIKKHPSTREQYAKSLISRGIADEKECKSMIDEFTQKLTQAQKKTREEKPKPFVSAFQSVWNKFHRATQDEMLKPVKTGVPEKRLLELSSKLHTMPSGFNLHPKLTRFFDARKSAIESGEGLDWGTAESLAYATLLTEGHPVRISGQDVGRGTFTHRQAVLSDFETGQKYIPLQNLSEKQGELIIVNSTLSETAVLGFEYGWSLADPNALVIWEAQFGDFANGAQVIIDQFIASGESKWMRASGVVLYLPHGYEGQGPEHSSARLERFLQLCGKQNMTVCNLTTPAQLFHLVRRQLKRDFRKPLVLMTPKSLLRHPKAISSLSELSEKHFNEVLDDSLQAEERKKIKRIVLCSGKIYYDLLAEKEENKHDHVAVLRLEQIYPFPAVNLEKILKAYPESASVAWVQEEPKNMGAWSFVFSMWSGGGATHFGNRVGYPEIQYIGRERGAAPAVGSHKLHTRTQKEIVEKAFQID